MTQPEALRANVIDAGRSRLVSYDFGAHLASWDVDGLPVVWLSQHATLDGSAPVRGGIPLCFPWFAAGPHGDLSPSHGLVRTATWRSAATSGEEIWAWELASDDVAGAPGQEHSPGPFSLRYAVELGSHGTAPQLRVALTVTNPAPAPLRVEAALHTYLAVADVTRTSVTGLDGAGYLDKVRRVRRRQEGPVHIEGTTDQVYDSPGTPYLSVDDGARVIDVQSEGATQSVIWNPGPEQAALVPDLGDEEWREFVCVESAATGEHALTVPGGASHRLRAAITVHHDTATL